MKFFSGLKKISVNPLSYEVKLTGGRQWELLIWCAIPQNAIYAGNSSIFTCTSCGKNVDNRKQEFWGRESADARLWAVQKQGPLDERDQMDDFERSA
jgi:hypothetical protein